MALLGTGKSILSCIQTESHGADINEKPRLIPGGKQRILMDNYQIPLDINNRLAYLRCRPPTPHKLETLPSIIMIADVDSYPSIFDNDISLIMDPFMSMGSINIKPLPSTTNAVNQTSFMRLSSLSTTTWLMICLTYGNMPMFAVHTT
jgi:hypothetical protein